MVLSLALRKSLSTSASVAGDMTFLIMVEIIKNVMSPATEAEVDRLFLNTKDSTIFRTSL